jgi:hypothetical protein
VEIIFAQTSLVKHGTSCFGLCPEVNGSANLFDKGEVTWGNLKLLSRDPGIGGRS